MMVGRRVGVVISRLARRGLASRARTAKIGGFPVFAAEKDAPPNAAPDRDALKQVLSVIRGGFPDVRARIDLIVAEGDLVAYHTISEGTHTKEYFGVAPTGKRVTLRQLNIDRIRDGKIVESWSESFGQGFHYQLTGKAPPVRAAAR